MKTNIETLSQDNISLTRRSKKHNCKGGLILFIITIIILISQVILFFILKLKTKDEIINILSKRIMTFSLKEDIQSFEKLTKDILFQKESLFKAYASTIENEAYLKQQLEQLKKDSIKLITRKKHKQLTVILVPDQLETAESLTNCTFVSNCYRMSRDGYSAKAFHERCDGLKPTLTMITTKNYYYFGGFTHQSWGGNAVKYDNNAMILSVVWKQKYPIKFNYPAINASSRLLPSFGANDVYISETESYMSKELRSYGVEVGSDDNSNDKVSLDIANIEVFLMKCDKTP